MEKLEDSKGEERQYLAKSPCLGNVVRNTESLVLQWIPAHCRIEGNERADRLAKEGSELEQIESDLTYREVKSIIKSSLNNKWKESHPEYNKQDGVYCLNRRVQTTIFRLRTGHNRISITFTRYLKSAKQISARVDRQQKRPNMCYRIAGYTAMLDSPSGGRE